MSKVREFLHKKQYDHPKLPYWRTQRSKPYVRFARDRDGLVYREARLFVVIEPEVCDDMRWNPDLNLALIHDKFRAQTRDNEGERFGFMLDDALRPAEVRYGDGFFNIVLQDFLRDEGFDDLPAVAAKLKRIYRSSAVYSQAPAMECREKISGALSECGELLTDSLEYAEDEAEPILAAAIAYYLDDRFHLTNQELLGLR
ncbi:MAG: hypothetical protein HY791_14535 [Deltaproteobacteria bacterium]|nr:hypothetical protein [Deltaproteobacteria bacterium]